ncbi:MAG: ribosome-binding factor A [Chloroflexi bacterium GWC2_73_18]|nr:MAG: ribosome-binding factor A [Chloroflexi bacterium GWC2_73_18]
MTARTDRIDALLRAEISELLAREVHDPGVGFATVTRVETTPDLRHARVWIGVIGDAAARGETLRALERAMPFVRRQLGLRLRLKRIPELHVRPDETAEHGTRVLRILHELEEGRVPEDGPQVTALPEPSAGRGAPGEAAAPEPRRRWSRGRR